MTSENYAQAGYEALKGGMNIETVLPRMREVLEARGHAKLYTESLRGLLARVEKEERENSAHITVARKGDEKVFSAEIKNFLKKEDIQASKVIFDETIVGGYILSGKGREVNASYKKSLLAVYRSLTT